MAITDIPEETLRTYITDSKTWKEILQKCGSKNYGNNYYIKALAVKYSIDTSHLNNNICTGHVNPRYKLEDILICNSDYASMVTLKNRLIRELKWEHKCSVCNLKEWNNKLIPIEIDHINGIHNDNTITNLRFICPNCHAQTDTYKGKNIINNSTANKIIYTCIDCKNTVYDINTRCIKCNGIKNRVIERPTYSKLLEECNIMSKEAIAKMYGVSRASINRWLKYYENLEKNK